ncbi:unnamed protein product, partial [marine sediment metagenome]
TVDRHPRLHKPFIKAQNEAQKRYLKWAKKKGYHIKHERMAYYGNVEWNGPTTGCAQPTLWLATLIQAIGDQDVVMMGYNHKDDFWHYRSDFENAFYALCKLKGVKAELELPFEWKKKRDLYAMLRVDKVPNNCWFSCEDTAKGKPCGVCDKCLDIKRIMKEVPCSLKKKLSAITLRRK